MAQLIGCDSHAQEEGGSAEALRGAASGLSSDGGVDWSDDPNVDSVDPGAGGAQAWEKDYPGFSHNPLFVSITCVLFNVSEPTPRY